jgi:hypothetical protein
MLINVLPATRGIIYHVQQQVLHCVESITQKLDKWENKTILFLEYVNRAEAMRRIPFSENIYGIRVKPAYYHTYKLQLTHSSSKLALYFL